MPNGRAIFVTVAVMLVFASGYAVGQRQVPTETVGQSEEHLRSLDLTGELDSVEGRPLRMRKITLQPGGVIGLHNHADRPAVTFLLQGQMTYHQDGQPDLVANEGDGFAEGRSTTHWGESTGTVPAVWVAVDIPQP
ncbi:MAG: cupin domain-containing protein [Acidobacteria bacterium]|nr:cupin domain-containing protein [Acidobacteriota bacterium]